MGVRTKEPSRKKTSPPAGAGYSGTPLPKKLGIKSGSVVRILGAPTGFRETLGELPEGVELKETMQGAASLTLWFIPTRKALFSGIERIGAGLVSGSLWMIWPKLSSALAGDLREQDVRAAGLKAGLVDYKICAVDETWSGLLFTRRKDKV